MLAQTVTVTSMDSGLFTMILVGSLILWLPAIAGMWAAFHKAGHPGWAAIIPIFNIYVMCKVARRPGWWLLLFFIPFAGIVFMIIVLVDAAKAFGKGGGYALGLIFLPFIFWPMLGFGSARYQGAAEGTPPAPA